MRGATAPRWPSALGGSYHESDVTDFEGTELALADAIATLGGVDAVVNTAGGGVSVRTISKTGPMPLETFQQVVNLNLVATFNVARLAAWSMSTNEPNDDGERGVIINTASIAAFEGQIGQVVVLRGQGGHRRHVADDGARPRRRSASASTRSPRASSPPVSPPASRRTSRTSSPPTPRSRSAWVVPDEYARLAVAIIENPMLNGGTIRLDGGQRFAPK